VIFGGATGGDMTTLTHNGMGLKITGASSGHRVGTVVSSLGDVNGDGFADVALSTGNTESTTAVYVVYGGATPAAVNLSTNGAIEASAGFRISAATSLGVTLNQVSSAGDVNGDGLADLIVGSRNGTAFVVYGNSTGADLSLNNATIAASNGFKIKYDTANTANSTISVSSAGDLNGDGLGDLLIGDRGEGADGSYKIVFGGTQWISNAVVGNGAVTGTAANEAILGSDDKDTLAGGGGVDRFLAGKGDDTVVLGVSDVANLSNHVVNGVKAHVHGGSGFDSIRLSEGASLNLSTVSNVGGMGVEENSRIESIERIDLATDTATNTLTLSATDVNDMAGFNLIRTGSVSADGKTWTNVSGAALAETTRLHQLVVDGTSGDSVSIKATTGTWANAGTVNDGTSDYVVWQNSATTSQLIVKSGVSVTANVAPIVIDLNRDGELSYSQLVMDVNSDGRLEQTAWAAAQDGVLVWDKHGDGMVHDSSQFAFSQYAAAPGSTDLQGLAAGFDSNQDGLFDAQDERFAEFAVWQDTNQNGLSDAGEVISLSQAGLVSIHLESDGVQREPAPGVFEAGRSTASATDGSSVLVGDASFTYSALHHSVDGSVSSLHADVTAVDLSATGDNSLTVTLDDVLAQTPSNGVQQLMVSGDADTSVLLNASEWTQPQDTQAEAGRTYAVFHPNTLDSAQPLVDEHLLNAARVM
jgi:hypothetical protein